MCQGNSRISDNYPTVAICNSKSCNNGFSFYVLNNYSRILTPAVNDRGTNNIWVLWVYTCEGYILTLKV